MYRLKSFFKINSALIREIRKPPRPARLKLIKKSVMWSKFTLCFHSSPLLPRGGSSGAETLNKHRISFKKPRHIVTLSCWWPRGPSIKSYWGWGGGGGEPERPEWEQLFLLGLGMGEVRSRRRQKGRMVEVEVLGKGRNWGGRTEQWYQETIVTHSLEPFSFGLNVGGVVL